ncbi:MAG: hypothetical protein RLZZ67_70 [Candidatus Parcubacteria bacterium]
MPRISTRTVTRLSSTGTGLTTIGTATIQLSATQLAHFSLALAGEFCLTSCPLHPPRFRPISSSFTESSIYFLSSRDLTSQRIMSKTLSASSLRMARRTYGYFSWDDRKLAAAIASIASINKESMRYPNEYLSCFGISLQNPCHNK